MAGLLWVLVLLSLTSSSTARADERDMQAATTAIAALPMPDPPEDDKDDCGFTDLDCKAKKAVNNWFIDLVGGAVKPVFGLLSSTVLVTPELDSVEMSRAQELWGVSRVIANTCFVLLVTAAGVLLMSGQTTPGGDLSPRDLLPRVIWGFLAANLSLPVIGYGISFANGLSTAFLQSGEARIDPRVVTEAITTTILASLATNGVFYALVSLVVLVLAVCVAFTYVMRLALTMVLIAAAPIALMFHALPLTDGLARLWWRGITGVLAIQVCQSLVLVTAFHLLFTDHSTMFLGPSSKADLIDLLLSICLLYVLVRVPGWVAQTIWRSAQPRMLTRLVTSLVFYRGLSMLAGRATEAEFSGLLDPAWVTCPGLPGCLGRVRYSDGGGLSARGRAQREQVRMQAAKMFEQGMRPFQVAEVLRVSLKSACAWHRTWQAGGAQALFSKGPAGQRCRLNSDQLQRLEAELDAGPAARGWADQRWTLDRVAELIAVLFGVHYTQKGISVLLHRLGWSPQISAHRPIERDEEAVTTWVKETWPRIKGQRRSRTDGSASRTKRDGS